jgi:multidrug resistance efflux pump
MAALQKTCAEIDKAKADDPFNLPPVEPDARNANAMTDEELAQQAELDAAQAEFEAARAASLAGELNP